MEPLVSVVIPTFNGVKYIRETLDSVLNQSYRALEVIVVDDGSTDSTSEAVAGYSPRVTLITQPRYGHPAARNRGLRCASGEFLSFLDHDDLWAPVKIDAQLNCFRDEPSLDLVFGHIRNFFSPEMTDEEKTVRPGAAPPVARSAYWGAMLARRSAFDKVGPFCEDRDMGDFLDWYGRAMVLGLTTRMLPDTVLLRRIHSTNFSRTHGRLRRQYLPAVKQLLDRRRAAAKERIGS